MSKKKPPSEKIGNVAPFGLRMLPELKAQIEESARKSGRSMNAEIVSRLEQSFQMDDLKADIEDVRQLDANHEARIKQFRDEALQSMDVASRTYEQAERLLASMESLGNRVQSEVARIDEHRRQQGLPPFEGPVGDERAKAAEKIGRVTAANQPDKPKSARKK